MMAKKFEKPMDKKTIYKIIESLKKGDTFIDMDGYKCHVLVNLKDEERIVFKFYGKRKQWWHYSIESYFWFELQMRVEDKKKGLTMGGRKPMKFTIKKIK